MSTKQKTILSIIASVLALVIVGLTVAIVLVANTVTVSSSMSVTFTASEVYANISCDANYVTGITNTSSSPEGTIVPGAEEIPHNKNTLLFAPGDDTKEESVTFTLAYYYDSSYSVRLEFNIYNRGNNVIDVECSHGNVRNNENMLSRIKLAGGAWEDSTTHKLNFSINPSQNATVYLIISIVDINSDALYNANGAINISMTGQPVANS